MPAKVQYFGGMIRLQTNTSYAASIPQQAFAACVITGLVRVLL